ncbi:MAG: extracellular solute-binding protein [Lentisphaeria bacterium]|nr:extracellular solute-binding protein [Lentisphaeria bacterium]
MWRKFLIAILPTVFLIAIAFILREDELFSDAPNADSQVENLVIITPNSDQIKYEFAAAFEKYYFEKYHKKVKIDYRNMGGTSDIVRYIYDRYQSEFKNYCENTLKKEWTPKMAQNFANYRLKGNDAEAEWARKTFLASDVSIGIDLFWGGGTYDQNRHAQQGFAVDAGVARRHPEYFRADVIPMYYSGEKIYDEKGRYYGVCLSSFGICYNIDRLAELDCDCLNGGSNYLATEWETLGDKHFFNSLILADPSKSGSVNKCFETIIQHTMQEAVKKYGESKGVEIGWQNGFNLIKKMVGNSLIITDSASKVTREVAKGNGAAGIAIDFYALSENEYSGVNSADNRPTIYYNAPKSGSPISADPIQLLRGAPNRQIAEEFIDFLLSIEGQKIWDYRVGTPGGPIKYALRRPPVRRDLYSEKYLKYFADPDYNPYQSAENAVYRGDWTGRYFNLIRILIRCTMLDVETELKSAWQAIIKAGGEEKVPQAAEAFNQIIVPYSECRQVSDLLYVNSDNTMLDVVRLRKKWSETAANNFRKAQKLAEEGK